LPRASAGQILEQARHAHIEHGMIEPCRLPAKLNPVENVRQFIRDNWLSNRIFSDYDCIVDHCCAAWNKLVDQPWKIMSIGMRDWAHRS
jgi:putative transposase